MQHEVAPALARKFGEPGGLFDTVLQRLVSEWHRYQVDRDPRRLKSLHEILEAGLAQLRSLELLLRTGREEEEPAERAPTGRPAPETPMARAVYAVDPAHSSGERTAAEPPTGPLTPSRMDEAMRLLDALQDALGEALGTEALDTEMDVPPPRPSGEEERTIAGNGGALLGRPTDGVFSHEAFDVASAAELKRCRRFERSFSLLLLDPGLAVDPQADRMILGHLREFDLVGRYGNGVLAIGLPETTDDGARLIGNRLVGLLSKQGAWSERGRLGIACYPKDGNTLTTVVRSARSQLGGTTGP